MELPGDEIRRMVKESYAKVAQSNGFVGSGNCYTGFSNLADILNMIQFRSWVRKPFDHSGVETW